MANQSIAIASTSTSTKRDASSAAKITLLALLALFIAGGAGCAQVQVQDAPFQDARYVQFEPGAGSFALVQQGHAAPIIVDAKDFPGVVRAAGDLQADINCVTSATATLVRSTTPEAAGAGPRAIIAGTLGHSRLIDRLVSEHKIDPARIAGQWESFFLQVVRNPMPGLDGALVIVGSDKRGTIYGIYDLSEQIGVSPWRWWADVPAIHRDALYVKAGMHAQGPPAVKYRGIFLNDEAPALTGWTNEKFGGYNSKFYVKVFELLLRLKANYLWPAMWNNCFNEDDPLNPKLADEYGIVMGTSHVEPMMRADKEWNRLGHTAADWNYATHPDELAKFWTDGIERNKPYENIITLAMRGKIDTPMTGSTDMAANIALLEKIVADQRKIIADKINPDLAKVPQLWALYKEVQEYYEKGMRVPDDVTLLWCDDNWGNIRRLPATAAERARSGGAGVYYHFDYVGDPRNYKWIDTNPIPKIWEQMNLALHYGADRIWIVNVGDLKPMEFPLSFFLSMAWNPAALPKENLTGYTRDWAARQFGPEHAAEIGDLISQTLKLNGRRKPELLDPSTYSLVNYQEADRVVAEYQALIQQAETLSQSLPAEARPAFFELVLHPVKAAGQVAELYVAAGKNRLYAAQGRASANAMAARVRALFKADQSLSDEYNHALLGGKWDHMMDQTHIGYTNWQQPPANAMPAVRELTLPEAPALGVAVEGSADAWPGAPGKAALPAIDAFNRQQRSIDIFNKGKAPLSYTVASDAPWIKLSAAGGVLETEQRLLVDVDWTKAPQGLNAGTVTIRSGAPAAASVDVAVSAFNPAAPARDAVQGFVESNGCVSIEAEHFTKKTSAAGASWDRIPDYGRTLSGMSLFPVTAPSVANPAPQTSPCLEYKMYLFDPGKADVWAVIGPTLDFIPGRGLRFAVSFDDAPPQIVEALPEGSRYTSRDWQNSVRDSVRWIKSAHTVSGAGYHTLKIWMVDPAVVLEKIVVDLGGMKPSYLGPPESYRH